MLILNSDDNSSNLDIVLFLQSSSDNLSKSHSNNEFNLNFDSNVKFKL